jgi:hypothetical protein
MNLTGTYYNEQIPPAILTILEADNSTGYLAGTLSWGDEKHGFLVNGHYGQQREGEANGDGLVFICFSGYNDFRFYQSWAGYAQNEFDYGLWTTEGTEVELAKDGNPQFTPLPLTYWKRRS